MESAATTALEAAADGLKQAAASSTHGDLTGIAIVVLAALACGIGMERLRQPAIVGYIVAGVLLGPSALGIVSSRDTVDLLAEMGVLLLLYVVGMELSLRIFKRLWKVALVATLMQIGVSTGVMLLLSRAFGWPFGVALVTGFAVALSSTAVAIKILDDLGETKTKAGRITIGVLIAQDLAVVPMMLAIDSMAGGGFDWLAVPKIAASILFLVGLIWYLSRGPKIRLPFLTGVAGNVDLKPLAALAFCFGAAAISGLLGLSVAYGAFLAGLVIGASTERHAMMAATQPIQSLLMMVFFLSVGLLLDLGYIWNNLGIVMTMFFLVAVFKTALNVGALRLLGQDWQTAFVASLMMAQVGEFSFLLSMLAVSNGVITQEDSRVIVAVTVLSLALSPLWVTTVRRLRALAAQGITEVGELTRLVYGREADFVAETFDEARSKGRALAWKAGAWVREKRAKREAGKALAPKPAPKKPDA